MSKSGRGRDSRDPQVSKQGDSHVPETDSSIAQQLGSHSSMGAIKTIGESDMGPVRMSYLGTYNRVVLLAIDASPVAKYAFNCTSCARFCIIYCCYFGCAARYARSVCDS